MKNAKNTPAAATAAKVREIMTAYEITENLTFQTITSGIRRGQQSIVFVEIFKMTHKGVTKKMKVDITRDAYDFQSHAKISIWNATTESWNEVAREACTKDSIFHKVNIYEQDPALQLAERRLRIVAGNLTNTAAEIVF